MEIIVFKFKSRILSVLAFSHSDLNILSYKSPFNANSFFFILDSKRYQPTYFQQKKSSYERDDFSKMTYEFYQQIGFVKKQIQITSQSIQTIIQVFISAI